MNWLESKHQIVRQTVIGCQKNYPPVFVSNLYTLMIQYQILMATHLILFHKTQTSQNSSFDQKVEKN